MRVVFLDFDGVLNSDRTPRPSPGESLWSAGQLDLPLVALLNELVTRSGAQIVVSSSWRKIHPSRERLAALLRARGFVGEVHDLTPTLHHAPGGGLLVRGHEVEQWLRQNRHVEGYVILDDEEAFLDDQAPFVIRTDPAQGLTAADVERALALLGA